MFFKQNCFERQFVSTFTSDLLPLSIGSLSLFLFKQLSRGSQLSLVCRNILLLLFTAKRKRHPFDLRMSADVSFLPFQTRLLSLQLLVDFKSRLNFPMSHFTLFVLVTVTTNPPLLDPYYQFDVDITSFCTPTALEIAAKLSCVRIVCFDFEIPN
jgi:hypothetical protein